MRREIWTIGHSNHSLDRFVELLRASGIEYAIDVRSYPYSRYAPQFDCESLSAALPRRSVGYLFLGEPLGGRPESDEHYDADGHALYSEMAKLPSFTAAIDRVIDGAHSHRVAIFCSCGKPDECHRRLLVGRVLTERGLVLHHVMPDGSIQEERAVMLPEDQGQETLFGGGAGHVEIYTIGFTQTSAEHFFGRLSTAGVLRLLDVRLNNSSQLAGFAKGRDLPFFLERIVGASYEHEPLLAPTQDLLDAYKKQKGEWGAYERGFMELMADRGVEDVLTKEGFEVPTALLCSEATAENCHRRLVCEYLDQTWGEVEAVHL